MHFRTLPSSVHEGAPSAMQRGSRPSAQRSPSGESARLFRHIPTSPGHDAPIKRPVRCATNIDPALAV
jgi:hypothetical protein